jgi:hypothetical protein
MILGDGHHDIRSVLLPDSRRRIQSHFQESYVSVYSNKVMGVFKTEAQE